MKWFRPVLSNSIFALNVFLIFLFFYRERLAVPVILQPLGRMHPMLLHLPIGILLLAALMVFFQNGFKKKSFHNFLNFTLYLAAFTAAITAVFGMLLSAEGGYAEAALNRHVIWGLGVSLVSGLLLSVSLYAPEKKTLLYYVLGANIVIVLLAGHFGSVLTRGENFVFQPLMKENTTAVVITDSTSLYAAAIYPVLEKKCTSCHNEKKAKGELIMTTLAKFQAGGEHGAAWVAGDPLNSLMIKRIHLPEANDDHMPPSGKPQLTHIETRLLYHWIANGADVTKAWTKFTPDDSLRLLANAFIGQAVKPVVFHYSFPFAASETIMKLNTPFCTVAQFAADEPALKADFFLAKTFDNKKLESLLAVKEQLVILNLAGMPLTAADGKTLRQFVSLEKIILNKATFPQEVLSALASLNKLKSISLAGTTIDRKSAETLGAATGLKEIFLWNTGISLADITSLQQKFPGVQWDAGYHTDEILRLTPPVVVNEIYLLKENEPVQLKHSMNGIKIRYTLDGSVPDSVHGEIYTKPFAISGYTQMRARAFKDGWYGSPETEVYFFKQGITPLSVTLQYPPNKDYKGEGVSTLTDLKKGKVSNFREVTWLGFREKPMIATFQMTPSSPVSSVTVSYGQIATSFLFPPASAEIWGGEDEQHLKLLQRIVPVQPKKGEPGKMEALIFRFPESAYPIYKLVANPIPRVPEFISFKPEKGWFFVDEVIFN